MPIKKIICRCMNKTNTEGKQLGSVVASPKGAPCQSNAASGKHGTIVKQVGSRAGFRRRHGLILGGVGSTILRSDLTTSNEQFQIAQEKYVHSILGPICQDHSTGRSATICSCSLGQVMLVRMLRLLRLARAVRTGAPIDRHTRVLVVRERT